VDRRPCGGGDLALLGRSPRLWDGRVSLLYLRAIPDGTGHRTSHTGSRLSTVQGVSARSCSVSVVANLARRFSRIFNGIAPARLNIVFDLRLCWCRDMGWIFSPVAVNPRKSYARWRCGACGPIDYPLDDHRAHPIRDVAVRYREVAGKQPPGIVDPMSLVGEPVAEPLQSLFPWPALTCAHAGHVSQQLAAV